MFDISNFSKVALFCAKFVCSKQFVIVFDIKIATELWIINMIIISIRFIWQEICAPPAASLMLVLTLLRMSGMHRTLISDMCSSDELGEPRCGSQIMHCDDASLVGTTHSHHKTALFTNLHTVLLNNQRVLKRRALFKLLYFVSLAPWRSWITEEYMQTFKSSDNHVCLGEKSSLRFHQSESS